MWFQRKCTCPAGFTGDNCEENINDCKFMDCGKNGYCFDGIDEAKCVCNPGFEGDQCQHAKDECEGVECHNGGRCVKTTGSNRVTCSCNKPWMGDHCNITMTTSCKDSPCQNFGQCMQKSDVCSITRISCRFPFSDILRVQLYGRLLRNTLWTARCQWV